MANKILKTFKWFTNVILFCMMFILIASMLLGSVDLLIKFYTAVVSPDPYPFVISVHDLYNFFSIILIIVVGYELFKSMTIILDQKKIPVREIMQIAMIALANKVITLDIKSLPLENMIGLGVIIACLGLAYFAYNSRFNKEEEVIED